MPGHGFDRAEQQSEREWSNSSDASDEYGSHGLERYLDDQQSKRYKGLDKSLSLQGLSGLNEHYNIIEDSSPIDTNVEGETGGLFEEANPGLTSIGDDEHQFYIRDMHNMSEDDHDKDDEVRHRDSYSYEDQSYVTEKEDSCDSESNQDSYQHETNDSCEDQSYETVTEDSCDSESDQGSYQHETKDSFDIASQLFEVDILDDNNKYESESDQGSYQHETKDSCDIESQLFEVDILDDNNKDDRICETMLEDNMDRCKNDHVMGDYMGEDEDEDRFESQLCIPLDRLEDIEMFPNFTDDFMSLGDFLLGPDSHDNDFYNLSKIHNDGIVDLSASEISNGISRDLPVLQYHWHSGSMIKEDYFSRYIKQTTDEIKEQETRISHDILGGKITKKQRTPCKRKRRKNVHNYQVSYPESNLPKKQQCSHCKAENTPQWRAGPLGPKTLCNACGVRYRLKKLVPEYRPLTSPTFDSKKHSNYHRKIEQRMNNQNRNNMEWYERF